MSGNFFNQATVLAGIHKAMDFGSPNAVSDKATFFMPRSVTTAVVNKDADNVPFNPDAQRSYGALVKKTVPCAVEFLGSTGKDTNFGVLNPDKIKITLLAPDYIQVAGCEYVVVSGDKYLYWKSEPVIALGSIDVHQLYFKAEDVL